MFHRKKSIEESLPINNRKPRENEVLLRCPICGKIFDTGLFNTDRDEWNIDITTDFDNNILNKKKVKFIVFMCYDCYDDIEYFEEDYDENGNFEVSVLCYDEHMNLVHQDKTYY